MSFVPIFGQNFDFSNFQKWSGNHDHFRNMQKSWLISSQYFAFPNQNRFWSKKKSLLFNLSPNGQNKIGLTSRRLRWGKMFECQTFQKQHCFQIYDQGVVKIDENKVVHFLTN